MTPGPVPAAAAVGRSGIDAADFAWIQEFVRRRTGIVMKAGKEALVLGRLDRRVRHHGLPDFASYVRLLARAEAGQGAVEELRVATDLLTTNETYFFREPQHLELLPRLLPAPPPGRPIRVWSAASSTGEEAWSIALVLADTLGPSGWEIVGTDVSGRVVQTANRGLYPLAAAEKIPRRLLKAYGLKGRGAHEGRFTLRSDLRERVSFREANLIEKLPSLGQFDIVFLRNVLIYFDEDTKRHILRQIHTLIRPGGHLVVGHAESITGLLDGVAPVVPSVYRVEGG
ncbi:CheR family methyltransferase [Spongisporangium articulatum]|uniref:protein-glutamate O-methyltransferase n=1 Tax=Spongisporangium articulatum TaxID=3362603 RepID=A0ABW8AM69_9ACTN